MENCITAAFRLDNYQGSLWDFYIYPSRSIIEQLNTLMRPFSRVVREVSEDEILLEDEWMIAMFGPFPTKYDYEHMPEKYDYHFIFLKEKQWMHRDGPGAPITPVNKEELFEYFETRGYPPQYFVVRRVEE